MVKRHSGGRRHRGFTLIEALVAVVLVSIGIVSVFGAIHVLTLAQTRAETSDRVQRLAQQKLNEITATVTDPNTAPASGDFSDNGYPDISWAIVVQQESATNVDLVTLTATAQDGTTQALSTLVFVRPQTSTGAGGTTAGGTTAGGATAGGTGATP